MSGCVFVQRCLNLFLSVKHWLCFSLPLLLAWTVLIKNHVDPAERGDAQHDRQGAEDEEGGAGSSGGPGLGCAQRVFSWHDLHWDVSCSKFSDVICKAALISCPSIHPSLLFKSDICLSLLLCLGQGSCWADTTTSPTGLSGTSVRSLNSSFI